MTLVFDHFFDRSNIKNTMGIIINRASSNVVECVGSILACLCSNAVTLNFTEYGFCPFKSEPFLIIPYEKMNSTQLNIIKQALNHCDAGKHFLSCSQMGLGSSIFMVENFKFDRRIDVSLVMLGLYQLIQQSSHPTHSKIDVYNIMTQRLLRSVSVTPEAVLKARELCLEQDGAENL